VPRMKKMPIKVNFFCQPFTSTSTCWQTLSVLKKKS
jgi:hypothetical protein